MPNFDLPGIDMLSDAHSLEIDEPGGADTGGDGEEPVQSLGFSHSFVCGYVTDQFGFLH